MKMKRILAAAAGVMLMISSALSASADTAAQTALNKSMEHYKTAWKASFDSGTSKADMWTLLCVYAADRLESDDYSFMIPQVDAAELDAESAVTEYSKAILSLVVLGEDPTAYAARNLAKELADRQDTNGSFGASVSDNAFAILALTISGYDGFDLDKAVAGLFSLKKSDGGYNDYGNEGSVDSTAMALMAFGVAGTSSAKEYAQAAVAFLQSTLKDSGYLVGSGPYDAPNSCSQSFAILGLVTAGEDVASSKWQKGGNNIVDVLLSLADENGGFWYDEAAKNGDEFAYYKAPDEMSTYQSILALDAVIKGESVWQRLAPQKNLPDDGSSTPSENSAQNNNDNPATGERPLNPIVWVVMIFAIGAIVVALVLPIINKKNKK